jgi:hypothetical protein
MQGSIPEDGIAQLRGLPDGVGTRRCQLLVYVVGVRTEVVKQKGWV